MANNKGIIRGVFIRPPEEVLNIVRCIDCRHYDKTWCEKTESGFGYCGELDMMTDKSWWCGSGEEKRG